MAEPSTASLETVVRSNEKLLKALITLLSLKDEHLLEELKTIFTLAAQQRSELGQGDPKVWREVRRELSMIDAIVHGEEDDEDDDEGEGEGEELH